MQARKHKYAHNSVRPYRAPRRPHGNAMLARALLEKFNKTDNWRAPWTSRGTLGTPSWPKKATSRLQGRPKSFPETSRWHNMAPRRPKEDSREAYMAHGWPKMAPSGPQGRPRASQQSPTWPKMATRWPQERAKKAQDDPKRAPRAPKEASQKH